jgi:hypothetical protein
MERRRRSAIKKPFLPPRNILQPHEAISRKRQKSLPMESIKSGWEKLKSFSSNEDVCDKQENVRLENVYFYDLSSHQAI